MRRAILKAFDLLPGWAWALLCSFAIAVAAVNANQVHSMRSKHLEQVAQWELERAAQALEHAKAQAEAREKEQTLQASADRAQQEKRREIDRLNRSHAAVLDSLRQRPERPASPPGSVPQAASAGDGQRACTGRELYREDAEFLLGEAFRADQIRLQLVACQAAYSTARELTVP
jgi:hypothetical protein